MKCQLHLTATSRNAVDCFLGLSISSSPPRFAAAAFFFGDAQNRGNDMKRIIAAACMIMMASAVNSKELLVVTMSATVSGGVHPIVTGRTNLPDGMKLVVELAHPCDEDQERRFMELDRGR